MDSLQLDIYDVSGEPCPFSRDTWLSDNLTHMADQLDHDAMVQTNKLYRARQKFVSRDAQAQMEQKIRQLHGQALILRAVAKQHIALTLPKWLSGVKHRAHAELLMRLSARHSGVDSGWAWNWPFFQATGFIRSVGIVTEDDFNQARTWVLDVLKEGGLD